MGGGHVRTSIDEGDGVLRLLKAELLVLCGGSVIVVPSMLFTVLLAPLDEAFDRAALREVMPLGLVDLAPLPRSGLEGAGPLWEQGPSREPEPSQ